MKILKKLNKKILYYSGVFLFSAILIFIGYNFPQNSQKAEVEVEISENNPSWNLYTNTEYRFSIEFPSDWKIHEELETDNPIINIYLLDTNIKPPFDHFADINNISIFPKGLQTKAVIGEYQKAELDFNFKSDKAIDYILEDGSVWATYISVWATYISFDSSKKPWKPWGFIWAKSTIDDLNYKCVRAGFEISLNECNPFEGDEFIRSGSTNIEIRKIEEEIISSFKFI